MYKSHETSSFFMRIDLLSTYTSKKMLIQIYFDIFCTSVGFFINLVHITFAATTIYVKPETNLNRVKGVMDEIRITDQSSFYSQILEAKEHCTTGIFNRRENI